MSTCESTVDEPFFWVSQRHIPVLFYSYSIDGTVYPDDMGRDLKLLPAFYEHLASGDIPQTSQINVGEYYSFLEPLVQKDDVLHIAFGSGMTGSVNNAYQAASLLQEKYPEHKIVVIDSLCSSSGYGMLVDYAADLKDQGKTMDEIVEWVNQNRTRVHHQFYSTDLTYYRHSGRISGPAALVGSVLNICPIMRLDDKGKIIAYGKVRGKIKARQKTIAEMKAHVQDGEQYNGKCYIYHSNCLQEAEQLKKEVLENFPNIQDLPIFDIGTIIASHCGPNTVAVFFIGTPRAPFPENAD